MARLFNILSFLSLLAFAWPLGTMARIILENTAIKSSSYNQPNKWQYLGCFNEKIDLEASGGERALYAGIWGSLPTLTVRICITFCDWNTHEYAVLEYAQCVLIHSSFPGN
jgi:hypothetical protein